MLSSFRKQILKSKKSDVSHSCLAHIALLVVVSGLAALCGVNQFLDHHILLQSVTSATFCILSGLLYAMYMIVSRVLALVLTYAERHTSHYYSDLIPEEYEDDSSKKTAHYQDCDNDSSSDNLELYVMKSKGRPIRKGLPRGVVISSMYLGGSGAFLAIPPLCMWDFTISSAFIASLVILSFFDCGKVVSDFRPNVDTGQVVTNLKALRGALHLGVLGTVFSVTWLDSRIIEGQVFGSSNGNNGTAFKHWGAEGLLLRWPLVLLAASSPILLRAGGGGVGPFMHSLPPSQTLETGLPVSILLSILVICWYSPLESTLLLLPPLQDSSFLARLIPMLILSPPFLSAALAFVLRGFRNRSSYMTAIILTCTLVVRQQIRNKMSTYLDWATVLACTLLLINLTAFVLYKRQVEMKPICDKVETSKLVVVVDDGDDHNDDESKDLDETIMNDVMISSTDETKIEDLSGNELATPR